MALRPPVDIPSTPVVCGGRARAYTAQIIGCVRTLAPRHAQTSNAPQRYMCSEERLAARAFSHLLPFSSSFCLS